MARPTKEGLDYFPLDVDIDQDDKISIIEALHGLEGFGIVIKLFMKIYKEGYFYGWSKREQILFSRRINVDINTVTNVVNDCINEGVFNKEMFEKHEILTSRGIQERYAEAVKRRKNVDYFPEFMLYFPENYSAKVINADIKRVNVDINPQASNINATFSTQSKVKESKVKESKLDSRANEEEQQPLNIVQLLIENFPRFFACN